VFAVKKDIGVIFTLPVSGISTRSLYSPQRRKERKGLIISIGAVNYYVPSFRLKNSFCPFIFI